MASRKPKRPSRSERKAKKLRQQQRLQDLPPDTEMAEIDLTFDPLPDPVFDALPRQVRERYGELYRRIIERDNPASVHPEIEELVRQYPEQRQLLALLGGAYASAGDLERSQAISLQMLERFPDYLLSKLQVAELYLLRGELDK